MKVVVVSLALCLFTAMCAVSAATPIKLNSDDNGVSLKAICSYYSCYSCTMNPSCGWYFNIYIYIIN